MMSRRKLEQNVSKESGESDRISGLVTGTASVLAQPIETKWRIWLRGVDLNHRPLGYEAKTTSVFNNLQDAGGP